MEFRERLRDEMEYQGISANALAELTGISKRTIDNYLKTNPQEPGVYNAQKIAKALKFSVEYLVTGKEYKNAIVVTGEKLEVLNSFEKLSADERSLVLNLLKTLNKKSASVR